MNNLTFLELLQLIHEKTIETLNSFKDIVNGEAKW